MPGRGAWAGIDNMSENKKRSVYFGDALTASIQDLQQNDSVSGKLNRMAGRYEAIVARESLSLTSGEKEVLRECLGDGWADNMLIRYLSTELAEMDTDTWSNDEIKTLEKLGDKFRFASFGQKVATLEELGL